MIDALNQFTKWCNENAGFLSLLISIGVLLFGWASGIFQALRNRPRFIIDIVDQPTFCCTFDTGRERDGRKTHRTAIVLYLKISNVGSAPSSIDSIEVGYHNHTFKYTFLWFWLKQTTALGDFCVDMGQGDLKIYPFLTQKNFLMTTEAKSYLEIGRSAAGIEYFEQFESWGGFRPKVSQGNIKIKVRVRDTFGKYHSKVLKIPEMGLETAQKFNEEFGTTMEKMECSEPVTVFPKGCHLAAEQEQAMNKSLENKVAVVTGASRGIGRAIALELAQDVPNCGIL